MPKKNAVAACLALGIFLGFAFQLLKPQARFPWAALRSEAGEKTRGSDDAKPPYNILFVVCDQESYRLAAAGDYRLPARESLRRRGVTFRNHYIGSAVCTPSRALFFTGQPPQINGVYDHLAFGFVPSLNPQMPNMGSVLKGLGYMAVTSWHVSMRRIHSTRRKLSRIFLGETTFKFSI